MSCVNQSEGLTSWVGWGSSSSFSSGDDDFKPVNVFNRFSTFNFSLICVQTFPFAEPDPRLVGSDPTETKDDDERTWDMAGIGDEDEGI